MGSSQSSPITAKGSSKSSNAAGGRGRKTSSFPLNQSVPRLRSSVVSLPSEILNQVRSEAADPTEEQTSSYEKSFSDDEEAITDDDESVEQLYLERQLVLEDALNLKKLAVVFLHPELPLSSEGHPRCYFNRASAPEPDTLDDTEEIAAILRDAASLKQRAVEYLHPERSVVTSDAWACGRNYFTRPSAEGCDDVDRSERDAILADAKALKALAVDYMHPETPVVTSDPTACARCFFDRPSGSNLVEDREEHDSIVEDTRALRMLAKDYHHPENPVVTHDTTATARCFFDRASAPDCEDDAERNLILAECAALKKLALDYKHPELPVVSDPASFARCYFDRASAVEQQSNEEAEEQSNIIADLDALKKVAVDYLHPEVPVQTSDPFATARCFFNRSSAPEQQSLEEVEECDLVKGDAELLKKRALDFLHPELPVNEDDATRTARCFFDRPSAIPQVSEGPLSKSDAVFQDLKALTQLAADYLHPERPVVTTDPTATARCYFDRFSATKDQFTEDMDELASILADAVHLKSLAVDYNHPELPVVTSDPTAMARCFFSRPSAPCSQSNEDQQERIQVLADARALKKLALDFMHPELPVTTTCSFSFGRNFFDRPAATYHDRMIHTFPSHEHDDSDHHHEHTDYFGMEDFHMGDVGFAKVANGKVDFGKVSLDNVGEGLEGNLSRSPSSVMLFQEE